MYLVPGVYCITPGPGISLYKYLVPSSFLLPVTIEATACCLAVVAYDMYLFMHEHIILVHGSRSSTENHTAAVIREQHAWSVPV